MSESSDRALLDLIRRGGPMSVAEMAASLGVTDTAIRNRLTRLVSARLVERHAEHRGRGRPRHVYEVSAFAQKQLGQNYADLALVLWEELMSSVEDRRLRRSSCAGHGSPCRHLLPPGQWSGMGGPAGATHRRASRTGRGG